MNEQNHRKLIIIGSGPAGLTAGIYSSRADLKPLIIDGPNPGGQLMGTTAVENWPGEKSIQGPELMQKMREHAKHFGAEFLSENITKVDFSQKPFKLITNKDKELMADAVIIATGALPKRLKIPGEDKYWGKGVSTCAVCDASFYRDKKVIVIGGGDTAMENASFLTKFTKDITIVQIEDKLTASKPMQDRVKNNKNIEIILNTTVSEIHGNDNHITGITLKNVKTHETKKLEADGVFIAIGLKPSTDIFRGQIELNDYGYVIVKNHTKTSVEGVFVAGDAEDYRYRQAITSSGSGCMAALDAEKYLSDQKSLNF